MAGGFVEGFRTGSDIVMQRDYAEMRAREEARRGQMFALELEAAQAAAEKAREERAMNRDMKTAVNGGLSPTPGRQPDGMQPGAVTAATPVTPGAPSVPGAPTPAAPVQPVAAQPGAAPSFGAQMQQPAARGNMLDALQRQQDVAMRYGAVDKALALKKQYDEIKKVGTDKVFHGIVRGDSEADLEKTFEDHGYTGAKVRILKRYSWTPGAGYSAAPTADIEVTRDGKSEVFHNTTGLAYGIEQMGMEVMKTNAQAEAAKVKSDRDNAREDRMAQHQAWSEKMQVSAANRAAAAAGRAADNQRFNQQMDREKLDFEKTKYADWKAANGGGGPVLDVKDRREALKTVNTLIDDDFPVTKDAMSPAEQASNDAARKLRPQIRDATMGAYEASLRAGLPVTEQQAYQAVVMSRDKRNVVTAQAPDGSFVSYVMIGSQPVRLGPPRAYGLTDPGEAKSGPPIEAKRPNEVLQAGNKPRSDMPSLVSPAAPPQQRLGNVMAEIEARRRAQQAAREQSGGVAGR